jgi:ABC-type multidrug transport system ATPase subunit
VQSLQSPPPSNVSFRVAAVTKLFADTVALWDVDLAGRSGELVAIHGANGSGKTTLMRIIAGLAMPTRGRVAWATDTPGKQPRIGLLGHACHLYDELTPLENVVLAARLAGCDQSVAADLLGSLGVAASAARRTSGLSAGTRRRVGLARLLATDPAVVLVDEPFAGLDGSAADLVANVLAESRDHGRLVVIATHDNARTRFIANSTAQLETGRLRYAVSEEVLAVAT